MRGVPTACSLLMAGTARIGSWCSWVTRRGAEARMRGMRGREVGFRGGQGGIQGGRGEGLIALLLLLMLGVSGVGARAGGRSFNGFQTRRPKAHSTIASAIKNDQSKRMQAYIEKTWDEELYDKHKSVVHDEDDIQRMLMMRSSLGDAERGSVVLMGGDVVSGEQKPSLPAEMANLPIPKRPAWKPGVTDKKQLNALEQEEFMRWRQHLASIERVYAVTLTPYEKNPEYWRNLWRVVERNDVVVEVVDARNPVLYRSSRLEEYIDEVGAGSRKIQKVLLLNKADLVPHEVRVEWAEHLSKQQGLHVLFFCAVAPGDGQGETSGASGEESQAEEDTGSIGPGGIASCQELLDELLLLGRMVTNGTRVNIGFVGYPNVGKSSVVNALCGEKRVAESKSAGTTKHLQTLHVGNDICLCDSPGIVFPSVLTSRAEMACGGMISVHNLQDAFEPAELVCKSVPRSVIEAFYGTPIAVTHLKRPVLSHADSVRSARVKRLGGIASEVVQEEEQDVCCAQDVLETLCRQRKFFQQRSGMPDVHRAAKLLVSDFALGRLQSWRLPPQAGEGHAARVDDWHGIF